MGMVELGQILPFGGRVAGQAAQWFSVCIQPRRSFCELAFVNILVATGAGERTEVIKSNLGTGDRLVAVDAGHSLVAASQREAGLLVHGKGVVGGIEGDTGVAFFAAVAPWISCKLTLMLILMAINAQRKLDFVAGFLAGGNMAIGALHLGVRRHQREPGFSVIRRRKRGWRPTIHLVATFAPASVRTLLKLAAVRVRSVAIRAIGKGNGNLEVRALVAGKARHISMFAKQRKRRLRVIEGGRKGRFLPRERVVARVTPLFELAFVGIGVTIGAR